MTKRKDEDVKEGFQIPIEDAADEAASDEVAAEEAETEEAEIVEDAQAAEEDIVSEAEAVGEEAAAAATGELEKLRKEASDWQDRYLRLHAEWDTYRRRTTEQRAEEKARAAEKLVESMLPVLDDFERSIAYATENGEAGLLEGVKAVQAKLMDVLVKGGVQVIDPAGEAFDETVHDVYQKGYKMGKKVIRPAMVTITTGGPKRPKPEESGDEE